MRRIPSNDRSNTGKARGTRASPPFSVAPHLTGAGNMLKTNGESDTSLLMERWDERPQGDGQHPPAILCSRVLNDPVAMFYEITNT
jgi:hypothetical protein